MQSLIELTLRMLHQDCDTGRFSLRAPPRPAATKISVLQSFFHGRDALPFADYTLLATDAN